MNNEQKIIVSLTSFPAALPYAVQAIRSVLEGTVQPDKVVLYLDTPQFPDGILPPDLEKLKSEFQIFEVRFDPSEIRSYKKLIPVLIVFPNNIIVTIDDDICYHPDLLRDLIQVHKKFPEAIIAHRVRKVLLDTPYRKWRKYKWFDFIFKKYLFDYHAMQTGVGGVLYPPHCLDTTMMDPEQFMTLAPTNDDIWFWAAAVSKGTYVIPLPNGKRKPFEIGKPGAVSLKTINLKPGDDRNREALENILKHYPNIRKKL